MVKSFLEFVFDFYYVLVFVCSVFLVKVWDLCCFGILGCIFNGICKVIEFDVMYMKFVFDFWN